LGSDIYEAINGIIVISFPTAVYEVTFLCVTRKKLVGDFSYRLNEIITGARNERPVDLRVGQF